MLKSKTLKICQPNNLLNHQFQIIDFFLNNIKEQKKCRENKSWNNIKISLGRREVRVKREENFT